MMNVLIVRTSSMGDLIHTWPAITELKAHYPNFRISWLAEEGFADIARLHPSVDEVITLAWRRWRKSLFQRATWREMAALRHKLRDTRWELVVDCQGLLKSALPAKITRAPLTGYDKHSIREPLACLFYDKKHAVSWDLSAVERCRQLYGKVFGYQPQGAPVFGVPPGERPAWLAEGRYAVLLHATSKASKEWPEALWIALADRLCAEHGLTMVLPWGSAKEKQRAERLAAAMGQAVVAPRISLKEAAGLIGRAAAVVGVDTGLTHLANALNVPLAAIYTDTDPARTGVVETPWAVNLGHIGRCPSVDDVMQALQSRRDFA
ncbi:lipopolysaccharide heptosyltransferase I [uncultured Aquitalea sp.]|nr:lipopolysaccharide heptosyltransferase I [uncultured Aquitalea sp.]